jgi:hypothetical protein
MARGDIVPLREIPYLDGAQLSPERFIASLTFHDDDWHIWVPTTDNKVIEIHGRPAESFYFASKPENPTDLSLTFLDFMAHKANDAMKEAASEAATYSLPSFKVGAHLYAPVGLPPEYEVVTTGDVSLVYTPLPPEVTPNPLSIQPNTDKIAEGTTNAGLRHTDQNNIWDLIWRKRVVYFLTVFATAYLFLYPLFLDTYAFEELRSRLRLISDAIRLLGSALPGFAYRWTDAYAREPAWFLAVLLLVGLLTVAGSRLAATIKDQMRHIWVHYLPDATPPVGAATSTSCLGKIGGFIWTSFKLFVGFYLVFYPLIAWHVTWLAIPGRVGEALMAYTAPPVACVLGLFLIAWYLPRPWVRKLRECPLYQKSLRAFKYKIAPFVSAFGLLFIAVEFAAHYTFNLADSFGVFCKETRNENNTGFQNKVGTPVTFDVSQNAFDSRVRLGGIERGHGAIRHSKASEQLLGPEISDTFVPT